jgi:hypothetical protein
VSDGDIRIILSSENWETKRQSGEELVAVQISPGVSVKMRKSEAIAKGLYTSPPAPPLRGEGRKRRKQAANKMRTPAGDKAPHPSPLPGGEGGG